MIKAKVTIARGLPKVETWQGVVPAFQKQAGQRTVDCIQALLGTTALYNLSASYQKQKPRLMARHGWQAPPGKPAYSPLYLSGGLYGGIAELSAVGNVVTIGMEDGTGVDSRGDDYGQMWEDRVDFLGKGLEQAEPSFGDIMDSVLRTELDFLR